MKTTLTEKEVDLVSQLRKLIVDLNLDEYEIKDDFLITWIRHANYDVKKAELALRANKKWRIDYNMDTILNENTKEFDHELPIEYKGLDKDGCPVMGIKLDRDVKSILERTGKDPYVRYMMKHVENIINITRKQHIRTGGTVNHFSVIVDMDGFSLRQLTTAKGVSAYTEIVRLGESNYPGVAKNLYVVNAPSIVKLLLSIIKPFMSADTISRLRIYDTTKSKWKEDLLQDYEVEQLPSFLRGHFDLS